MNDVERDVDEETGWKRLTVVGYWDPAYVSLVEEEGYVALRINQSRGFRGTNLNFLRTLPSLRKLELVGVFDADQPVEYCGKLEHLVLNTAETDPIDFSYLPELRRLGIESVKGKRRSAFELPKLEDLYVTFTDENVEPLESLPSLKRLRLGPARRLTDISALHVHAARLEMLGLYYCTKLVQFDPIGELCKLTTLEIHKCSRVENIDFVKNLSELRTFHLVDCKNIASAAPLCHLKNLEHFIASGSTVFEDGDISVLGELPKLHDIAMANRRHYSGFEIVN